MVGSARAQGKAASVAAKAPSAPNDTVRRLQIGVSGVVLVLLLVSLAGIASDRARENIGVTSVGDLPEQNGNASGANGPLENLGVQPVSKDAILLPEPKGSPLTAEDVVVTPRSSVPDLEPDPTLERARQNKN